MEAAHVAATVDLWRCTVCGRVGTVGRCCGKETREMVSRDRDGNRQTLHPLAEHMLYGDIEEMPLDVIGAEDTDMSTLDTEQCIRLAAAATVQAYFDGILHRGGYRWDANVHAKKERLANG